MKKQRSYSKLTNRDRTKSNQTRIVWMQSGKICKKTNRWELPVCK